MAVEEGVGDVGFALDGLEGDGLAAFDQPADCLVGGFGFRVGFGFGGSGEDGGAPGTEVGHARPFRWLSSVSGTGPAGAVLHPAPWTARLGAACMAARTRVSAACSAWR